MGETPDCHDQETLRIDRDRSFNDPIDNSCVLLPGRLTGRQELGWIRAEEEIRIAQSLIDTASQKKELSEIYCVKSMINWARIFINPASFGSQYGPVASQYIQMAERMNSENPRALYLDGWEKNATPKIWGGNKKARELLESAKQKLGSDTSAGIDPHWGMKEVDELLKQLK